MGSASSPVGPVVVVGAGIAGTSCARALVAAGVEVVVRDRGRAPGGRMSSRQVAGRPVDTGAGYFTCTDPAFRAVVDDWARRGLAEPWTDTFHVADGRGLTGTTTGPLRWRAPRGLSSLVADLASGLAVESASEVATVEPGPRVDGVPVAAAALAMPDPQARDIVEPDLAEETALLEDRPWAPALSLFAGWRRRCWPEVDGVFVNDDEVLTFVADDGRRRGDGAPVLVAHSTAAFADARLDEPETGLDPMLARLRRVLAIPEPPVWVRVRRWSLARPTTPHDADHHLGASMVGLCGDAWGRPRVQTAFLSGRALGRALAARLSGRAGPASPAAGW